MCIPVRDSPGLNNIMTSVTAVKVAAVEWRQGAGGAFSNQISFGPHKSSIERDSMPGRLREGIFLSMFSFIIAYRPGLNNKRDSLSCRFALNRVNRQPKMVLYTCFLRPHYPGKCKQRLKQVKLSLFPLIALKVTVLWLKIWRGMLFTGLIPTVHPDIIITVFVVTQYFWWPEMIPDATNNGNTVVLTVVDRLPKTVWLIALPMLPTTN